MRLTAAITPEDAGFVAQCLEVDVASQGDTVEAAIASLREALELYFEGAQTVEVRPTPVIAPIDLVVPRSARRAGAPRRLG